ncbi:homeobox protein BEL1 homolog [Arachis duranensis]|uniref:Homeobox protein BEL1 homolog n=1 Tax=Arachis duranensis TaxID=130453 RepID=A0A9C6WV34_ARADU|nr:homeobox protein BEL1 homolog [Arachis duranensis]
MDTFGSVELDFSSYTQQQQQQQQGFNGVSLTLGLQQHGGSGVSLAFPPPPVSSHHSSLFYATTRDQIMDSCPPSSSSIVHHYSLVDGEPQNLPYRNLMGAQFRQQQQQQGFNGVSLTLGLQQHGGSG